MTRNPRTARGGITLDMLFGRTKPVTPFAGRIVIGTADGITQVERIFDRG